MKTELTNFDVYVLSREISPKRLEKLGRTIIGYRLKTRPGRDLLLSGKLLIPTFYSLPPLPPDRLCSLYTSRIGPSRVTRVEQVNFDRILSLELENGRVVLELFRNPNIILVDKEGRIIAALEEREWKDRKIKPGEPYVPPPSPTLRPDTDFETFVRVLSGKDIVRSLVRAGIPPIYAEEVCVRSGIPKDKPVTELSEWEKEHLFDTMNELFRALERPKPTVYLKEGEIVDITPFPLQVYEGLESRHTSTLSDALELLVPHLLKGEKKEKNRKREQLLRAKREVEEQIRTLERMLNDAYAHSGELLSALDAAREGRAPPRSVGPFTLKRWNRKEIVYDYSERT